MISHPLYDARLLEMDIAVFDLETTGLFPSRHAIIQVASVLVNGGILADEWETKVNPGDGHRPIPEFIEEFTGIQDEDLDSAPDLIQMMTDFDSFIGTRVVAGHNVKGFDLGFVRRAEQKTGIDVQSDYYVDTLKIIRRLRPNLPSKKLGDVGRHYGFDVDDDDLHDALVDTRLCAQIMVKQFEELADKNVLTFSDMIDFLS